ncbi:MAG: hypothetical protein AMDU5_GPLC00005G0002 [Thermoplasmatales archaeon Gpl]|nr:MAG: hypothetical protein AMDU5_GPLC00005G0002 [Thermoplasmatales archaeon Gpl]
METYPNQTRKYGILEVKTEMINEIQETEKYEVPKSDPIYRNKDTKELSGYIPAIEETRQYA